MIKRQYIKTAFLLAILFVSLSFITLAQKSARLPKAEKVIDDYFKAAGGKKRLAAIKDAVYQWNVRPNETAVNNSDIARVAQARMLSPAAWRFDSQSGASGDAREQISFESAANTTATNGSSVWQRGTNGKLQTLTGAEAHALRLQAMLAATHLTDLKNQRIAMRMIGVDRVGDEPVYVIEFAMRNGAAIRYFFGQKSKLPLKITNSIVKTSVCFEDYRQVNNIFEPHKMIEPCDVPNETSQTYELQKLAHNTGLNIATFDAPRAVESFDVAAFLSELTENQEEIERRVAEYTFTETRTEREFDDKGTIEKEIVRVYEVFPVVGSGPSVYKLVSENGVALSPERAEKELRRVTEELEDAERKNERKKDKPSDTEKEAAEVRNGISSFLRASEMVAPRREEFRGRNTIVFDFRPRPGFKPQTRQENVFSKLVGTAWIDPTEKKIIRMELRFPEGFSALGGFAKLKSGSAFLFEQTRMTDGVWLPRLIQINLSAKAFFFAGINVNEQREYSNYVKFDSKTKDYKIDKPGENANPQ